MKSKDRIIMWGGAALIGVSAACFTILSPLIDNFTQWEDVTTTLGILTIIGAIVIAYLYFVEHPKAVAEAEVTKCKGCKDAEESSR